MEDNFYSVLVLSCDKYSWLWPPFFKRFEFFWPDKRAKIYLLTNYEKCQFPNVNTISIGEDMDWSTNLLKCIERIDEQYIFIMFEDVFLNECVDSIFLNRIKKFICDNYVEYINTKANPLPNNYGGKGDIVDLKKGMHYRASLANAFWRKDVLQNLLKRGESPWEFEHNGSMRSNKYDRFYGTTQALLSFDHIVVGGKLTRKSSKLDDVKRAMSASTFPVMTITENFMFDLKVKRNKIFSKIVPTIFQQKIRNAFR